MLTEAMRWHPFNFGVDIQQSTTWNGEWEDHMLTLFTTGVDHGMRSSETRFCYEVIVRDIGEQNSRGGEDIDSLGMEIPGIARRK